MNTGSNGDQLTTAESTQQGLPVRTVMKVKILRQQHPGPKPYWQTFDYDGDKNASVGGSVRQH